MEKKQEKNNREMEENDWQIDARSKFPQKPGEIYIYFLEVKMFSY